MKTKTFDNIINGILTIFVISIVLGLALGISYALMFGLKYGLVQLVNFTVPIWSFHLVPWIISVPLTFIYWACGSAHKLYNVSPRDCWTIFAVFVDISIKNENNGIEINKWLEINTTSLCRRIGMMSDEATYAFLSKKDAVAFKLRWM